MLIKTSELTGPALNYMAARADNLALEWRRLRIGVTVIETKETRAQPGWYSPSTDWVVGGPIIERESISIIRIEDESVSDAKGFWQGKYKPVWGAVIGIRHSDDESHNGYDEPRGAVYEVTAEDVVTGPTPLIAAMRCYVASHLGDEVDVPEGLA